VKPIRVFLDTEFTQFDNPKLISIGLAAEDGRTFYRELNDSYAPADCSEFVTEIVLPLLSRAPTIKKSTAAVAADMYEFLQDVGTAEDGTQQPVRIVADYHTDVYLVERLWRDACGVSIPGDVEPDVGFVCIRWPDRLTRNEFKAEAMEYLKAHNLKEHHALNDARSILWAFQTLGYEVV
jgi:hypothetical protein